MTFFEKSHKTQRFYYNLFWHSTLHAPRSKQTQSLGFARIFIFAGKVPKLMRFIWHQLSAAHFNVAEKCNFRRRLHFCHRAIKMMHNSIGFISVKIEARNNEGKPNKANDAEAKKKAATGYWQLDKIKMQWYWYLLSLLSIAYTPGKRYLCISL